MNSTTPWEERLRLAISGTPRMYGIGITEETIVETVRSLLLAQREEMKKGLEVIREKYITSSSCQNALGEAIAVVERV